MACFFIAAPSCHDEERVPYVYVYFTIYPDLPDFNVLKTPGNSLCLTGGARGIVVYCDYADHYVAFDRNCTYEPTNPDAVVDVDSSGLFLVCRHCKSKFMITDGSVAAGPAKYYLVQYATHLDNGALTIYNKY